MGIRDGSMKSDWVKWEVEQSIKMGKGVVAVYKGDKQPVNIPKHITDNTNSIISWNHTAMMKAVDKAAKDR